MNKVAVQCRNVRLSYGSTEVLKDVSLDIEPGEFFALLGPSGSGKSTLLRLIAGFNRHQHGQVLVDGRDVSPLPPWQRHIGMVFQNYALWPHLSVWDNVAFGLVERRVDKATLKHKVGAALDLVGLQGYGQRRPNQLSGGQQQRVALARTIVIEPQVLLLDEPLSNLDKTLRVQMRQELLALQRRLGLTTLFVTHDQEEAMSTADRMAVLDQGVVQQVGTPTALYDEPVNRFVAGFVGTMNLLPATVLGHDGRLLTLEVGGIGTLQLTHANPVPRGARLQLSFRPDALRLQALDPAQQGSQLALAGTVEAREFLGAATRYRVRMDVGAGVGAGAGEQVLTVDVPHRRGSPPLAAGSTLQLVLAAAEARVLTD